MPALVERPYIGAADLEPLLELLLLCRAADNLDPWPPMRELRRNLDAASPVALSDTRLWQDASGALQAFASVWDGEMLIYCIHPRAQSDELLERILAWGQARVQRHAELRGECATLCVALRADNQRDRALLERQGFTPEPWWTLRMARPLDAPLPAASIPDGIVIRPLAGEAELEALVELHQAVFATGSARQERLALMRDADYRPELDLVAVAPNGALTGFCTCSLSLGEDQRHGRREGWVELLGTQRNCRRTGVGRALLLSALAQLQTLGADAALLGVTSWNTQAQHLYASVGFKISYPLRWYVWEAATHADGYWILRGETRREPVATGAVGLAP